MPLKYKIFPDRKLIYVVGEGRVVFADVLKNIQDLARDENYVAPMKKLVDHRNTSELILKMDESLKFTEEKKALGERFKGEKCAIVVNTDFEFGMTRVHGAKVAPADIETNVFRDLDEALAWLEVEVSEDERDFA